MSAGNKLLLGAYSLAWKGAAPFLGRFTRLKDGYKDRLVPQGWPCADAAPACGIEPSVYESALRIWVQAASGGEAWLTHALLPALVAVLNGRGLTRPLLFLCTSCTKQGMDVLEKLSPDELSGGADAAPVHCLSRYLPLDDPTIMNRAMQYARPHVLVLLETELWPGLLAAAKRHGVPVCIANARMRAQSLNSYRRLEFFWKQHAPERVLAISEEDADRFAGLFGLADHVGVMPNIKFDRAADTLEPNAARSFLGAAAQGERLREAMRLPEHTLLAVLASVREEEEDALLPVLRELGTLALGGRAVALAVAPRHMHRVEAWRQKLGAAGLPFVLRSMSLSGGATGANKGERLPVFLWDSFGELQRLYAAADAAFVGGSLAPLGGQNFLEPAAQGLVPVTGPYTENFAWVGEEFFALGLAVRAAGAAELAGLLAGALQERMEAITASTEQGLSWKEARTAVARGKRACFAAWLGPRTGGSMQAAEAIARVLAVPSGV